MAAAAGLVTWQGILLVGARGWRGGSSRLAYRVGESDEVVGGGRRRSEVTVVAYEIPASGGGEAAGVGFAEVVRVRLGEGRERPDDGRGIAVDVGQGGNRLPWTAVAGAAPW